MAVQTSYPGVYIDEFAPGAPIQGVGTGVAAFLGPTTRGVIARAAEPEEFERLTSFDRFRELYGDLPLEGYSLWYAVRGFFQNGGQACYLARVSNGDYATWSFVDRTAAPGNVIFRVRLRTPGPLPASTLALAAVNRLPAAPAPTVVYRTPAPLPTIAVVSGRELTLTAGGTATFRPGDCVTIAARPERPRIARIAGNAIRIDQDLTPAPAVGDTVRLANLAAGDRELRINAGMALPADVLVPGSILTITQGANTATRAVSSVLVEPLGAPGTTYRVMLRQGLPIPFDLAPAAAAATVTMEEFSIQIVQGAAARTFTPLATDPSHPRYFRRVINDDATAPIWVTVTEPPPAADLPQSLPTVAAAAGPTVPGAVENLATLTPAHYGDALRPLERIDEINLVAAPDATVFANPADTATVQMELITSCERLADRFAVLDARPAAPLSGGNSIEQQRNSVPSTRGYAALYYPWIRVAPAEAGPPILTPPSGHMCGIMSRTDATRGVHKAPANAIVDGALGVERMMTDIEQGFLNLAGINVIRVFRAGGRPEVWGARTTATDRNWQYVNIRRLFLFLEESIAESIRWAVFEPNNLALWQKLRRTIRDFLRQQWRDGALFGAKEENAFYVRIDEALNPFSEQQLGRLHIEIGVRPSYPAEFIIVRIGIWDGGSEVTES